MFKLCVLLIFLFSCVYTQDQDESSLEDDMLDVNSPDPTEDLDRKTNLTLELLQAFSETRAKCVGNVFVGEASSEFLETSLQDIEANFWDHQKLAPYIFLRNLQIIEPIILNPWTGTKLDKVDFERLAAFLDVLYDPILSSSWPIENSLSICSARFVQAMDQQNFNQTAQHEEIDIAKEFIDCVSPKNIDASSLNAVCEKPECLEKGSLGDSGKLQVIKANAAACGENVFDTKFCLQNLRELLLHFEKIEGGKDKGAYGLLKKLGIIRFCGNEGTAGISREVWKAHEFESSFYDPKLLYDLKARPLLESLNCTPPFAEGMTRIFDSEEMNGKDKEAARIKVAKEFVDCVSPLKRESIGYEICEMLGN